MKAILWTMYGPPDVLELHDVEQPTPKDNEILVRIFATTVTAGDCEMRRLKFPLYLSLPMRLYFGFSNPRAGTIPGSELAGVVEATGKDVTLFKAGDEVFGSTGLRLGACAEYICIPEKTEGVEVSLAIKPTDLPYAEAVTVPFGGRDALHFIRKGNIQSGQKVLINGAGGSIGVFAVQLARFFGAEVTAVDSSGKLEMLRTLGAEEVIDYTQEDFTQNGQTYDVIFDVVGKVSLSRSARSIKQDGTYLLANPNPSQLVQGLWARMTSGKKVIMQPASGTYADLVYLRELIEAGKIKTVIDRRYPLEEIIEAHRYVETGQKKGNVVITTG